MKEEVKGVAEFKVVCDKGKIQLLIHGKHVVAETTKDVYSEVFEYIVWKFGGRIDK